MDTAGNVTLPERGRGRLSPAREAEYEAELAQFCGHILEIQSRLDFKVSSRGWCYILENDGSITKGEFDRAQQLINDCRKAGLLPLNICAEEKDATANLEALDHTTPSEQARGIVASVRHMHRYYTPLSFWEDQPYYLEMLVEKVDLKTLFEPVCKEFHFPIANAGGWADINSRAAVMRRFKHWAEKGKNCVLLWCGDHDPGGLIISDRLRANFQELAGPVGWHPDKLTIDRFGLNHDFITAHGLTWIDNLETGSGKRLDDPKHPDHLKPYVQNYLGRFGARKVEANALVVSPEAGRDLCRRAILKYVPATAPKDHQRKLNAAREQVRVHVQRLLGEMRGDE
jgi:hypothetical protein